MSTTHPIVEQVGDALQHALFYTSDPVAVVVAQRLIRQLAPMLAGAGPSVAYGKTWPAIVGLMHLADTLTETEQRRLELTMRQRTLLRQAEDWAVSLGLEEHVRAAVEDVLDLAPGVPEHAARALEAITVIQVLHPFIEDDTTLTPKDAAELAGPILDVLAKRGVVL